MGSPLDEMEEQMRVHRAAYEAEVDAAKQVYNAAARAALARHDDKNRASWAAYDAARGFKPTVHSGMSTDSGRCSAHMRDADGACDRQSGHKYPCMTAEEMAAENARIGAQ